MICASKILRTDREPLAATAIMPGVTAVPPVPMPMAVA